MPGTTTTGACPQSPLWQFAWVPLSSAASASVSTAFAIDASDDADAGAAEAQVNAEKAMMSASTRATVDFIFFIVFLLFLICIVLFLIIGKLRVFGHGEHVYRLIGRGYLRNEIEQIFILGGLFVLHIIIEPCSVRHGSRRRIDIRARGYEINGFAAPRAAHTARPSTSNMSGLLYLKSDCRMPLSALTACRSRRYYKIQPSAPAHAGQALLYSA